ncbi:MAG TPA: hypothetical protein VFK80_01240, partial [Limnochordia bacterium]|nr:hypothetical protein [Limnochordia bacterium]
MSSRFWVSIALVLIFAGGAAQADEPDVRAISRFGFTSDSPGPYVLFGTDIVDHPQSGHTLQMQVTNLQSPETAQDAIRVAFRSEWSRYTLFGMYQLGGTLSWSQRGPDTARSVALFGEGVLGRIQGSVSATYQEPGFDPFAWTVDPNSDLVSGAGGGYQLDANVQAKVGA